MLQVKQEMSGHFLQQSGSGYKTLGKFFKSFTANCCILLHFWKINVHWIMILFIHLSLAAIALQHGLWLHVWLINLGGGETGQMAGAKPLLPGYGPGYFT
jgi:hypothetical protein